MNEDEKAGYGRPPKQHRWHPGQSGNPNGRPKANAEYIEDAARILSQPVNARTPNDKIVRLEGLEAAYLALCKKGLKGDTPSLLEAIRMMLDVAAAAEEAKKEDLEGQRVIDEMHQKLERIWRQKGLR